MVYRNMKVSKITGRFSNFKCFDDCAEYQILFQLFCHRISCTFMKLEKSIAKKVGLLTLLIVLPRASFSLVHNNILVVWLLFYQRI